MKRFLYSIALCGLIAQPVFAAKPGASTPTGNDVSYPQCGSSLPKGQAFGVVGVNNGIANSYNPCFGTELAWAQGSVGGTNQPKFALYVNTGNPEDVLQQYSVTDWPSSGSTPYGTCSGTYSQTQACAWEYGYERAQADTVSAGTGVYDWWLDVETGNSWSANLVHNQATLEGMVKAFNDAGAISVGIYSTSAQWSSIAGTVPSTSSLSPLKEWRPGARTANGASSNCALAPFTPGGSVTLTQWTQKSTDYDHSCI